MGKEIKFVFIGHVDTGKSTLSGHLKYKCGQVEEHKFKQIINKAKEEGKERMIWSNINDIFDEEKEKGKTHEYHVESFSYKDNTYFMIDTPGHLSFIREMIEGVTKDVNTAVLMVSAIGNEFESSFDRGMLKEHTMIARVFGIRNIIVVINKMDKVKWEEETYKKIQSKVKKFLDSIAWKENRVFFVPLSAYDGTGVIDLEGMPDWYKGKSFLETLNDMNDKARKFPTDLINGNILAGDFKVLDSGPYLISPGMEVVLHYQTVEDNELVSKQVEAKLVKIKDKKLLKTYEAGYSIFKTDVPITGFVKMAGLVRKGEQTLGYFKVVKMGKR